MKNSASDELVLREFRGWENALKAAVEGKVSVLIMIKHRFILISMMEYFMKQGYIPGASGCGAGSGFAKLGNTVTIFGRMGLFVHDKNGGDYKFDQPGLVSRAERHFVGHAKYAKGVINGQKAVRN